MVCGILPRMPNRSSSPKPPRDPVASAYATMQRIIERTESDPAMAECIALRGRVAVLERLCGEVRDFARIVGLPPRVVMELDNAARGRPLAEETLLPITAEDSQEQAEPPAVALGRAGGLKGGRARADALSAKRRKQIAKKAAQSRWRKPV